MKSKSSPTGSPWTRRRANLYFPVGNDPYVIVKKGPLSQLSCPRRFQGGVDLPPRGGWTFALWNQFRVTEKVTKKEVGCNSSFILNLIIVGRKGKKTVNCEIKCVLVFCSRWMFCWVTEPRLHLLTRLRWMEANQWQQCGNRTDFPTVILLLCQICVRARACSKFSCVCLWVTVTHIWVSV